MLRRLKKTELKISKSSIEVESSVLGRFRESFLIPKRRIDHLATRNLSRSRSSLVLLLLASAAFAIGEPQLSMLLLLASIAMLLSLEKRKVLMTSSGQGIKLYISEEEWESLRKAI